MRIIKFRGLVKGLDTKRWAYGGIFYISKKAFIVSDDVEINLDYRDNCQGIPMITDFVEVLPETVGQYIGLKDKDGVEIYRGDVLKVLTPSMELDNECEVEWDNEASAYYYEPHRYASDWDLISIGSAMKEGYIFRVIGNFWEDKSEVR